MEKLTQPPYQATSFSIYCPLAGPESGILAAIHWVVSYIRTMQGEKSGRRGRLGQEGSFARGEPLSLEGSGRDERPTGPGNYMGTLAWLEV